MSAFPGRTAEYGRISLDRFDGDNLASTVFFLSHAHSDHMKGLDSPSFKYRLQSDKRFKLYCSDITRKLLLADASFSWLKRHMVALPYDVPTEIHVPNSSALEGSHVVVTLTPCGHCLGAAMVLLEGDRGAALYTGDFRLDVGTAARLPSLHTPAGTVKDIRSMYCDTTFFAPDSARICSREESEAEIVRLVGEHLRTSATHAVLLHCKAKIGYESVYMQIYRKLGLKVHVSASDAAFYSHLPDVAQCVTSVARDARVHACCRRIEVVDGSNTERNAVVDHDGYSTSRLRPAVRLWCAALRALGGAAPLSVLVIQLSTMWFVQGGGGEGSGAPWRSVSTRLSANHARVCYSFHSSASEVADFVTYVQPQRALANVCPVGRTMEETNARLAELLLQLPPLRSARAANAAAAVSCGDRPQPEGQQRAERPPWRVLPERLVLKRRFLDDSDAGCKSAAADEASTSSKQPQQTPECKQQLTDSQGQSDWTELSQSTPLTSTPEMDLWSSSSSSDAAREEEDDEACDNDTDGYGVLCSRLTDGVPAEGSVCQPSAVGSASEDAATRANGQQERLKCHPQLPLPSSSNNIRTDLDLSEQQEHADGSRTPTSSDTEDMIPPSPKAKSLRTIPCLLLLRNRPHKFWDHLS